MNGSKKKHLKSERVLCSSKVITFHTHPIQTLGFVNLSNTNNTATSKQIYTQRKALVFFVGVYNPLDGVGNDKIGWMIKAL